MTNKHLDGLYKIRALSDDVGGLTEDELLTLLSDIWMISNEAIEHPDE